MDPLYANLDKRNNSADQPQTPPTPQPTAYSMPNFGQPTSSSTAPTGPIVSNPSVPTPNATAPTTPIVSTPTRPTTSGTGDIILNIDQPKKKSKGGIIAAIILLLLAGAGAFILFTYSANDAKTNTLALQQSLNEHASNLNNLKNIISAAQEEDLSVNDMLSDSSSGNMNKYMDSIKSLQKDMKNYANKNIPNELKDDVKKMSNWLDTDIELFMFDIEQYDIFINAFSNNNSNLDNLPEELIEYFNNLENNIEKLENQKCDIDPDNKNCAAIFEDIQYEYSRNDVAKYVFSKTIDHDYYELITQLNTKIEAIKK